MKGATAVANSSRLSPLLAHSQRRVRGVEAEPEARLLAQRDGVRRSRRARGRTSARRSTTGTGGRFSSSRSTPSVSSCRSAPSRRSQRGLDVVAVRAAATCRRRASRSSDRAETARRSHSNCGASARARSIVFWIRCTDRLPLRVVGRAQVDQRVVRSTPARARRTRTACWPPW